MRAYRSQILNYLTDYEKARTTEEVLNHIASFKGETYLDLTDRRRRSIISCLRSLAQEKTLLSKKQKDGTIYWAIKREYLDNIHNQTAKTPLKELIKNAKKTARPIRFFRG